MNIRTYCQTNRRQIKHQTNQSKCQFAENFKANYLSFQFLSQGKMRVNAGKTSSSLLNVLSCFTVSWTKWRQIQLATHNQRELFAVSCYINTLPFPGEVSFMTEFCANTEHMENE